MKMVKRIAALMTALMLLIGTICVADSGLKDVPENMEDAKSSVVRVYAEEDFTMAIWIEDESQGQFVSLGRCTNYWTGSAVAVGKKGEPVNYFVTNKHVVISDILYETFYVTIDGTSYGFYVYEVVDAANGIYNATPDGSNGYTVKITNVDVAIYITTTDAVGKKIANVLQLDDRCDLAVIKVADAVADRVPAIIRTFDEGTLGNEDVAAIGFPGISDNNDKPEQLNSRITDETLTKGSVTVVKSHTVTGAGEQIQHDAHISGGNSGGALVDEHGYLIGINYATWSQDNNYSLAVSSNEVVRLLNSAGVDYATTDIVTNYLAWYIAGGAGLLLIVVVVVLLIVRGRKKDGKRTLVGMSGVMEGKSFPIKGSKTIGCDQEGCDIRYPMPTGGISRRHCKVEFRKGVVKVTDIGSSYGTWIDSVRLEKDVPVVMHRGQTLYLGSKKESLMLR